MGQNSSSTAASPRNDNASTNTAKAKTKAANAPALPNFVVPENRVMHNGANDVENAKRLLRPVSQELAKVHPEFADIFPSDHEGDESSLERSLERSINSVSSSSNKENCGRVNYRPNPSSAQPNGRLNTVNSQISQSLDYGLQEHGKENPSYLQRRHSMTPNSSILAHRPLNLKRQSSLSSIERNRQPPAAIPEDPREHLYNVTRAEPFSNLMPGIASLPIENSFESEISMNLTYAQLTEHRRQQRVTKMDAEKQKKLTALGKEIGAANTVPKSPFDRANLGAKTGTLSVSTGSSDNGVSKSKKKRAPPPPTRPSATLEPPIDYDMDDVVADSPLQTRSNNLISATSGVSGSSLVNPTSSNAGFQQNRPQAQGIPMSAPPAPLPQPPPPPPPPSSTSPLPSQVVSPSQLSTQSSNPATTQDNSCVTNTASTTTDSKIPGKETLQDSIAGAKAQLELLRQMQAKLKADRAKAASESNKVSTNDGSPAQSQSDKNNEVGANGENSPGISKEEMFGENTEMPLLSCEDASKQSVSNDIPCLKKMSSLLQYDIILAAQAKGAKQRKGRPPSTVLEKPKDREQVFREELLKAARSREERRKEIFDDDQVSTKGFLRQNSTSTTSSIHPHVDSRQRVNDVKDFADKILGGEDFAQQVTSKDESSSSQSVDEPQNSFIQPDRMSVSSDNSHRMFSPSWTPADDLDPDDDIIKEDMIDGKSKYDEDAAGFKQSMIPTNIKKWKDVDVKKKKKLDSKPTAASDLKENNKFGSIRRFKNTVRDSVKNVFTPKSKKNGKCIKEELLQDPNDRARAIGTFIDSSFNQTDLDASDNWKLATNVALPFRRSKSDDRIIYVDIDDDDVESSDASENEEVGDIDFASGLNETEIQKEENEEVLTAVKREGEEESGVKKMKRAGVAYVSGKGQIIVLPEYNTIKLDVDGKEIEEATSEDNHRAPRLFKKKSKKMKYESTVRVTERMRREELMAQEIREKETQIERERLRQQEMEMDFRRLRDLDAQERLQRMQTNSILEQLSLMQRQQISHAHAQLGSSGTNSFNQLHPAIPSGVPLLNGVSSSPFAPASTNLAPPNAFMPAASGPTFNNHLSGSVGSFLPSGQTRYYNLPSTTSPSALVNLFQSGPQRPTMSTSINASLYTSHTSPIIGGDNTHVQQMNTALPNLSPQELAQITDYMRMMGVTPPTTEQQWSFLLNSMNVNISNMAAGLNQVPNHHVVNNHRPTIDTTSGGSSLSSLFGINKTLESTLIDSTARPHSNTNSLGVVQNNSNNSNNHFNSGNASILSRHYNTGGVVLSEVSEPTEIIKTTQLVSGTMDNSVMNFKRTKTQEDTVEEEGINRTSIKYDENTANEHAMDDASEISSENQSESMSVNTSDESALNESHTLKDESESASASSLDHVDDLGSGDQCVDALMTSDHSSSPDNVNDNEAITATKTDQHSSKAGLSPPISPSSPSAFPRLLSPKVYGPIGFRPVTFRAGAS